MKIFIFRSGVVFTPEVGMKHVDRRWKSYPVGKKGKSPESKHEVNQLLYGRVVPCQDERLEKGSFLKTLSC